MHDRRVFKCVAAPEVRYIVVPPLNPKPQPRTPSPPKERVPEAKQWSQKSDKRGKKYYYNSVTKESQYKTPDCLKKYRLRP